MKKNGFKETEEVLYKFMRIVDTQGSNAKADLIASFKDDEEFLYALKFYLDDNMLTGLKAGKIMKKDVYDSSTPEMGSIREMIDYLLEHNSGKDEDVSVAQKFLGNFSGRLGPTCLQLLIKRMEGLNVGISLVNKAIPGFMVEVKNDCMLCDSFWDDPDYWEGRQVDIDPKLDGYRMRVEKRKGKVSIISRSGKPVTDLPHIIKAAEACPHDDFVLDGERVPKGFQKMTKDEQFKATQNSRKSGRDNSDIVIGVYDGMSLTEWDSRKGTSTREERIDYIKKIIKGIAEGIEFVEPLYSGDFDLDHVIQTFEAEVLKGKEGVILKDRNAVYVWDRTQAQVKLKEIIDADVKVIGMEEGTGSNRGKLGAVVIEGNCKTSKLTKDTIFVTGCKCGTGFKKEERELFWKNRDLLMGKTIEVLYMQTSKNKDGTPALRMPRFKCIKTGE